MANNITNVTLSIQAKMPHSHLIKIEEILVDGAGTLAEAMNGGEAKIEITLDKGVTLRKLAKNEMVSVQGTMNGHSFMLPAQLQVTHTSEPWRLSGTV